MNWMQELTLGFGIGIIVVTIYAIIVILKNKSKKPNCEDDPEDDPEDDSDDDREESLRDFISDLEDEIEKVRERNVIQSRAIHELQRELKREKDDNDKKYSYLNDIAKNELRKQIGQLKIKDVYRPMEQQKFISVWREGQHWFDSPETNQQEVEDMLVKRGISAKCVILPQGETPKAPKVKVIKSKE